MAGSSPFATPIPAFARLLSGPSAISGLPAKKAVPNLITALRETDVGLKSDAATALGMLGMEDVDMAKGVGALIALLGDQQRVVRAHAANSLGQFGHHAKAAIPSLCGFQGLQDSYAWEVRKACAYAWGTSATIRSRGPTRRPFGPWSRPCTPLRAGAAWKHLTPSACWGCREQSTLIESEKKGLEDRVAKDRDKSVGIWARVLLMLLDEKSYL